jgi:uncharacterized iron-regulated protein
LLGCSTGSPPPLTLRQPVVLLGEVHDNAAQHALRLQALTRALDAGARPVLAMEQIDRELQPALDTLLARTPRPNADAVIALAQGPNPGMGGWQWAYYKPYLEAALSHGLPIVAANVSRADARQVMRMGLAATGFDADVPEAVLAELSRGIEDSHCGQLDSATARRMALAQVARDQNMARVVEAHAATGVVLLAGNGHVRTDLGAPRWLSAATRARSEAIGVLEDGDTGGTYDRRVYTAVQVRPDPCDSMRPPAAAASAP